MHADPNIGRWVHFYKYVPNGMEQAALGKTHEGPWAAVITAVREDGTQLLTVWPPNEQRPWLAEGVEWDGEAHHAKHDFWAPRRRVDHTVIW